MGLFDGGLFDFNFDGKSSLREQLFGTTLLFNALNDKSDDCTSKGKRENEDEDEDEY